MPYIIHTKNQVLSKGKTPAEARKNMKDKNHPFYKNSSAYEKEIKSSKTTYVSKKEP